MLVLKVIGLVVCMVVAGRSKRARVPLVLLLVVGALLLRGVHCDHDEVNPRKNPAPTLPGRGLLGPTGDENACPDPKNCTPPGEGADESVKAGPSEPGACPDPKNCTPPGASADAVRDPAQ
ncbi:MAG TPA: hypothetical protein VLM79_41000 [Kofleriaceae bacterium]|nr:hypothetical protein [Kofleriaceae bacterium]